MEKAVKQGAVVQEKLPEALLNGKDAVPLGDIDQMKGHRGSALYGVFIAASRAEAVVAIKWHSLIAVIGLALLCTEIKPSYRAGCR